MNTGPAPIPPRRPAAARVGAGLLVVGAGFAVLLQGRSAAAAAQSAPTGRLTGAVYLTAAKSPSPASAYDRRSVSPRPAAPAEARNVIVFFEGIAAVAPLKPIPAAIVQKNEQFIPPVVAVTTGSEVAFPNEDPFFHNVFSLSRPATFDLGHFPPGSSRSRVFRRPGLIKVYCQIHSHMSAVARVFDHPWFTIPETDGTFSIDGVPAGEHTVVAWHERFGERRDRVNIRPGATATLTVTLPALAARP